MQIPLMFIAGTFTGIFAGLFGIGGGVVLVPILVLLFKMPQHSANGTSLVALLLPVGIFGTIEYFKAGKIAAEHIKYGLLISVGLFLGTYLGSRIAILLPEQILRRGFSVLLGLVAIRLWFQSK